MEKLHYFEKKTYLDHGVHLLVTSDNHYNDPLFKINMKWKCGRYHLIGNHMVGFRCR